MALAGAIAFGIGCSLITDLSVLEGDGGARDATVDARADAPTDATSTFCLTSRRMAPPTPAPTWRPT